MNHRMAVWTNRYQVCYRVNLILFTHLPNWHDMVDVNKSFTKSSEFHRKIKSANSACMTMMRDASRPCFWIPFVCIDCDAKSCAFRILFRSGEFFREWSNGTGVSGIPRRANSR